MIVELNDRSKRLFWEGRFIDKRGYIPLNYYDDGLINKDRINEDENKIKGENK